MNNEHVEVLRGLRDLARAAIDAGDWVVDGACDPNAVLRRADAAIASLSAPQPPAEAQRCTCPSGDGSLRWPCPAHPPEARPVGVVGHVKALRELRDTGDISDWRLFESALDAAIAALAHPPTASAPVGVNVGDRDCLTTRARELLADEYRKRGVGTGLVNDAGTATNIAIAAIATALAPQPADCPKCGGTGEADSGGIHPWGAPAMIPCDCQQPAAVGEAMVERALEAYLRRQEDGESLYGCVTAALTAALAAQQGGPQE